MYELKTRTVKNNSIWFIIELPASIKNQTK